MEALHAMYNMCKLSPTRQEAAALAGIVPLLVKLASASPQDAQPPSPSPPQAPVQSPTQTTGADSATSSAGGDDVATVSGRGAYPLRPLAVSLLCGMAHSTHRARHELWAHNVVALLLDLLKEEVCGFSLTSAHVWQYMQSPGFHADVDMLLLAATSNHCSDVLSVCVSAALVLPAGGPEAVCNALPCQHSCSIRSVCGVSTLHYWQAIFGP